MKKDTSKNRLLIIGVAVLITAILLGVNVSATVDYQIKKMPIDDVEAKLQSILNNKNFVKIKQQAEPLFLEQYNETTRQWIYNDIMLRLHDKLPTGYDPICPLLADILLQLMLTMVLLFGHGLFGIGMAMTMFWSVGLCGSMIAGLGLIPGVLALGVGGAIAFVKSFIGDETILYDFGLLGVLILFIILMPVILCLLVIAVPVAYIVGVLIILEDCYNYCYDQW